jgi:hypothetical protein
MYWKQSANGLAADFPSPVAPDLSSDTMGLIARISEITDALAPTWALRLLISDQLEQRYKSARLAPRIPGMIFGPTSLPPGHGASTEVVVSQSRAHRTLELLYEVLSTQASQGEHVLGPVAVRFVPKTKALLGMNIHDMNCFIELPSVRNQEVLHIYKLWWDTLEREGIPYTCHWGQLHGMTPARVIKYFGDRVQRWKDARVRILPSEAARRVFASPLLAEVGLG